MIQAPKFLKAYPAYPKPLMKTRIFVTQVALSKAQVPAVTIERVHHGALLESGMAAKKQKEHNVSRDAYYRAIRRFGIGWHIKQDVFNYVCEDGDVIPIHFMLPRTLLGYLLKKEPQLLFGAGGIDSLPAFWHGYRMYHEGHIVFSDHHQSLHRVIPLAVHGDEGRGKRRSSTTVVSIESVLGIKGKISKCACHPFHLDTSEEPDCELHRVAKQLHCNLKGHSFLQHFPLFVIPGVYAKQYKDITMAMLELIADDLRDLYQNGLDVSGERFYIAIVASKGDLKWYSKICRFTRGYERKGRICDVPCCHVCQAGSPGLPAEDVSSSPAWVSTMYQERPWSEEEGKQPALTAVPFDWTKPEFTYKHDILHTLRLGVFRDFVASTIFLFLRWDLFGAQGNVSEKLERAHGHFKLWLCASNKTAALRSFTPQLFKYTNRKSFPWANVKGSDCALLLQWISTLTVGLINDGPPAWQLQLMQTILATSRVATSYYSHICTHGMFQVRNCASVMYERGQSVINGYVLLASWAFENQHCLFAIKPKIHFMKHMLVDVKEQLDRGDQLICSPLMFDCSQNEDLIGRLCRLGRRVDGRVISSRVLLNYTIKAALLAGRELRGR